MKFSNRLAAPFTFLLLLAASSAFAQSKFHGQGLAISVSGTSSIHDWVMKSKGATCDAVITVNSSKASFSSLSFSLPVETLKSGHGAMDKNTYKAMDTKKNPNISFVSNGTTTLTSTGANTYLFKGTGKLTIAGNTKVTDMTATLKYNPTDKSFTCTGSKKIKMSEYGVKPPTAMMGTIKTGDAISIDYNITIKE